MKPRDLPLWKRLRLLFTTRRLFQHQIKTTDDRLTTDWTNRPRESQRLLGTSEGADGDGDGDDGDEDGDGDEDEDH